MTGRDLPGTATGIRIGCAIIGHIALQKSLVEVADRTYHAHTDPEASEWQLGKEPAHDVAGASKNNGKEVVTMADRAPNLQDTFLNYVRKNKTPVTIFLINGVKLQGVVTWFDNFCVLLRRDGHSQLVYKHAISTVMPGGPVQLFEPADEA